MLCQKRVVCTKHLYLNNYKDAQFFCLFERKKPSLPFFIVEKRYVSSIIAACCYSIEQNTSKTKTKVYHIRTCIVIPGPLVVKSASILGRTCDDDVTTLILFARPCLDCKFFYSLSITSNL